MNCGRDENPTYHTSILLNVSFLTLKITWKSLIQKVIMEHFLVSIMQRTHLVLIILYQISDDSTKSVHNKVITQITRSYTALISEVEPKHIDEAMQDDNWVKDMQEELNQFQKNDVGKVSRATKGQEDYWNQVVFLTSWMRMIWL